MHRIDGPAAVAGGYFTDGDPQVGTPATICTDDWLNAVQEELIGVLTAAGDLPNKASNAQLATAIKKLVRLACPVGTVWEGYEINPPAGTLHLAGGIISRTSYADLWNFASSRGLLVSEADWWAGNHTRFSVGDGSTTMRLPDLRWEYIGGLRDGSWIGRWTDSENKSHTHGVTDPGHAHAYTANPVGVPGGAEGGSRESNGPQGASTGGSGTGISIQASGGTEAKPRTVTLLRCIYY